ncbi:MAG: sialidase family protein, partial [Bacteroidetes bacterium]|nr:sialidase family protein [Bacteroidota bacterium]
MRFLTLTIVLSLMNWSCSNPNASLETHLFINGEGGYQYYRIPALIQTPQGVLFAFAEGRKTNCEDFGNVDILLKKSVDGGRHWSQMEVVADYGELQAGNPAPVVDLYDPRYPQGRIFLFY